MVGFSDKQYSVAIDFNSSGDNTLIAAPSAGRIVVDHIHFIPQAATVLKLIHGSTDFEGAENFDPQQAKTIENLTGNYEGIYTCGYKEALILNSSQAVEVQGYVKYRIIDAY